MSAVKDLFNGKIKVFENLPYNNACKEANEKLDRYLAQTDKKFPKKNGVCFSDKIREQVSELETNSAEQAFEAGFVLGVRLMAECFGKPSP